MSFLTNIRQAFIACYERIVDACRFPLHLLKDLVPKGILSPNDVEIIKEKGSTENQWEWLLNKVIDDQDKQQEKLQTFFRILKKYKDQKDLVEMIECEMQSVTLKTSISSNEISTNNLTRNQLLNRPPIAGTSDTDNRVKNSVETETLEGFPYSVTSVIKSEDKGVTWYRFTLHCRGGRHVQVVSTGKLLDWKPKLRKLENTSSTKGVRVYCADKNRNDEMVFFVSKSTKIEETYLDYTFNRKYYTIDEAKALHFGQIVDIKFKISMILKKELVKNPEGKRKLMVPMLISDSTDHIWLEVFECETANLDSFQVGATYRAIRCITKAPGDMQIITTLEDTVITKDSKAEIIADTLDDEEKMVWKVYRIKKITGRIKFVERIERYSGCPTCRRKITEQGRCAVCQKEIGKKARPAIMLTAMFDVRRKKKKPTKEKLTLPTEIIKDIIFSSNLDSDDSSDEDSAFDESDEMVVNEEITDFTDDELEEKLKKCKSLCLRKTPSGMVVSVERCVKE